MHKKEHNSNALFLCLHCRNENYNVTKRMRQKEENGHSFSAHSSSCNHRHDSPNAMQKMKNNRRQLAFKVNRFTQATS